MARRMWNALVALAVLALVAAFAVTPAKAEGIPAEGTWGTCPWEIDADGVLTIHPGEGVDQEIDTSEGWETIADSPWADYYDVITAVVIKAENGKKVIAPEISANLFSYFPNATSIDLSGLDTSKVVDARDMFYGWKALKSIDVSRFDTSNMTNMQGMFRWCKSLTNLDVSNFNTANVTDMSLMFAECSSLRSLNLSNFNTSKVTDMFDMFSDCYALAELDISSFNTSKVESMDGMFYKCHALKSIDVSNFNTSSVTSMYEMFRECDLVESLDLSSFNTTNVTNMCGMFLGCYALKNLNLSSFSTSNVGIMEAMFCNCEALTSLDVSRFDTSNVRYMNEMFYCCLNLTTLDISNFDTRNACEMDNTFYGLYDLQTFKVGRNFVQPEDSWSAPDGEWVAMSNGMSYSGYELAHRGVADTYTRYVEPIMYPDWVYTDDGDMYYYESADKMVTDDWRMTPSGLWLYLGLDGKAVMDGVGHYKGNYYFIYRGMVQTKNVGWKQVGDDWYYFGNAYSAAYKNQFLKYGKYYVYFGADGKLVENGWAPYTTKGKTYYYYIRNYVPVVNDWVTWNGARYHFNSSGICDKVSK